MTSGTRGRHQLLVVDVDTETPIRRTRDTERYRPGENHVQASSDLQKGKRKVGGKRYEPRSGGRSSPDTFAFRAYETPRR